MIHGVSVRAIRKPMWYDPLVSSPKTSGWRRQLARSVYPTPAANDAISALSRRPCAPVRRRAVINCCSSSPPPIPVRSRACRALPIHSPRKPLLAPSFCYPNRSRNQRNSASTSHPAPHTPTPTRSITITLPRLPTQPPLHTISHPPNSCTPPDASPSARIPENANSWTHPTSTSHQSEPDTRRRRPAPWPPRTGGTPPPLPRKPPPQTASRSLPDAQEFHPRIDPPPTTASPSCTCPPARPPSPDIPRSHGIPSPDVTPPQAQAVQYPAPLPAKRPPVPASNNPSHPARSPSAMIERASCLLPRTVHPPVPDRTARPPARAEPASLPIGPGRVLLRSLRDPQRRRRRDDYFLRARPTGCRVACIQPKPRRIPPPLPSHRRRPARKPPCPARHTPRPARPDARNPGCR